MYALVSDDFLELDCCSMESVKEEGYQCFNAAPGNSFPVLSLLAALAVSFAMFW